VTASSGTSDRYGYTGREADSALGLQYNRGRIYDPATGKWMSVDPMGFAAGDLNLYRYVRNNPTNLTDPSGDKVSIASVTISTVGDMPKNVAGYNFAEVKNLGMRLGTRTLAFGYTVHVRAMVDPGETLTAKMVTMHVFTVSNSVNTKEQVVSALVWCRDHEDQDEVDGDTWNRYKDLFFAANAHWGTGNLWNHLTTDVTKEAPLPNPGEQSTFLKPTKNNTDKAQLQELAFFDAPGWNFYRGVNEPPAAKDLRTASKLIAITIFANGTDGKSVGIRLKVHIEGIGNLPPRNDGAKWISSPGYPLVDPGVLGKAGGHFHQSGRS
jgi:RHS repeat-associated protein